MFKYGFTSKTTAKKVQKIDKHSLVVKKIQERREKKDLEALTNIYTYMHVYKWMDGGLDDFTQTYLNDEIRVNRFKDMKAKGLITTKYQSNSYFDVDLWN